MSEIWVYIQPVQFRVFFVICPDRDWFSGCIIAIIMLNMYVLATVARVELNSFPCPLLSFAIRSRQYTIGNRQQAVCNSSNIHIANDINISKTSIN